MLHPADFTDPSQVKARPCPAEFYSETVERIVDGKKVYEDVDKIKIFVSRSTIHNRRVKEEDKQTYAPQWRAYKADAEQLPDGTPLKLWPGVTGAQVKTLALHGVHTVEQLSELSSPQCDAVGMGAVTLVTRAKDYLARVDNSAASTELSQKYEALQANYEKLKEDFEESSALIQKLMAERGEELPKKRKRVKKKTVEPEEFPVDDAA